MLAQRPIVAFVPTKDFAKARAFYEGIIGLSVVQSDAFAIVWTSPSGAKVAWFKDPDGNVLSISQP